MMLDAAMEYVLAGFRVFPVKQNKAPYIKGGVNSASDDPAQVRAWWAQWPNANIGIATGNASRGLIVIDLDVDPEKGIDGRESLHAWEAQHGALPATLCSITGRGGNHLLYYSMQRVRNRAGVLPGVDVRGDGGYIVAPPSVHANGQRYQWCEDCSIRELLDGIAQADQLVMQLIAFDQRAQDPEYVSNGVQYDQVIPSGQRTDTLVSFIGTLRKCSTPENVIAGSVRLMNATHCQPPLSEKELQKEVLPAIERLKPGDPEHSIMNVKPLPGKKGNGSQIPPTTLITMTQVQEEEQEWLVPGFIPKGDISCIAGDGGVGKTAIWCSIASSISAGKPCFFEEDDSQYTGFERKPQKVMFFSSEDDPRYSLKKRLRLCGANMDNIATIPISDERFARVKFNDPFLEELIKDHRPALMIFDPLQSFIPSNVNMGYRNAMREMMNPLVGYGEKYGVSFLIMMHTNKRENASGRNRVSDSSDIWDIARCFFTVGKTGEGGIRYMSHEKMNNAPEQNTVLFTIEDGVPKFKGMTTKKDRDFVNRKSYERAGKGAKEEAEEMVLDYLKDGEKEASDLDSYASALSISARTLQRAKADLKKRGLIGYRNTGQGESKKHYVYLVQEDAKKEASS